MSIIKLARALTSSAVIAGLIVSIKYLNDKYIQMEEDAEKEAKEKFEKESAKNVNAEKPSNSALKKTVKNQKPLSPEEFLNSKENNESDKFEFPTSSTATPSKTTRATVVKKNAVKKPVARKTKPAVTKVDSDKPAVKKATKKATTPRKTVTKTDTPASDNTPTA